MQHIYLDHAATTPLDPRVREAMEPYLGPMFGNASSAHWHGRQTKSALEAARAKVAEAIGAHPSEIFFTSGGTEADNLALLGSTEGRQARIVTVASEHHAVLDTCLHLRSTGAHVHILPVDRAGAVDLAQLDDELQQGPGVISVMHANNEVGTIQPVQAIAGIAADVNSAVENIGARRLHTVMERLLDEVSYSAPDRSGETVRIDAEYVRNNVGNLAKNTDLSRFIL